MRAVYGAVGESSEFARLAGAAKTVFDGLPHLHDQMLMASDHLQPAFDVLAGSIGPHSEMAKLSAIAKGAFDIAPHLHEQAAAFAERMRPMIDGLRENSAIADVSRKIEDQFRAIDNYNLNAELLDQPKAPAFRIPPNPLYETNERLERIEKQFERMESIAAESASIATGLQASAAEFLVKFEKAANENNQTAKRAIVIGICAIAIALIMPAAQIIYTEFWRAPLDAAANQEVTTNLRSEISELQKTQRDAAERLGDALAQSNGNVAATLMEIRDLLSKQNHVVK